MIQHYQNKPVAKSVLIPLGLTVAASAADAGIHKKILGSGNATTLVISNNEMEGIIKIAKFLEDSGLFLKAVTEKVQNEVKEQKGRVLSMLLGTLGANLLGSISEGKEINRAGKGQRKNRTDEGMIATGQGRGIVKGGYGRRSSKMDF